MWFDSTKTRRAPWTTQLWLMLTIVAIGLSFAVARVVTDGKRLDSQAEVHRTVRRAAQTLARRAAPLLERGDDLRLAVLAASVADVSAARVLLLDRKGEVRLDTGLSLGGQQFPLETSNGGLERELPGDEHFWEVLVPALANSGFVGEVRLRYRAVPQAPVAFAWEVFGLTLLSCLSLVVISWWVLHHWLVQLGAAAARVRAIGAASELEAEPMRSALLAEMNEAVNEAAECIADERRRACEAGLDLARRIVKLLEQRELVVAGHGERTKRLALELAEVAGLPASEWQDLGAAASLIDLGNAGVRQSALTKTGDLSSVERESLRHAPGRGAGLLQGLPHVQETALAIRHHHEKYDGTGYPDGLRGDRIPIASRILAIANAYDLLTTDTRWGDALSWPAALERLHEDRGEHFDPELLDLFESRIREDRSPSMGSGTPVILQSVGRAMPYKLAEEVRTDSQLDPTPEEIAVEEDLESLANLEFEVLFDDFIDPESS